MDREGCLSISGGAQPNAWVEDDDHVCWGCICLRTWGRGRREEEAFFKVQPVVAVEELASDEAWEGGEGFCERVAASIFPGGCHHGGGAGGGALWCSGRSGRPAVLDSGDGGGGGGGGSGSGEEQ